MIASLQTPHQRTLERSRMATIQQRKIATRNGLAPGGLRSVKWNKPPWITALGYFAHPLTPTPSGQHGSSKGAVEIASVSCSWDKDNETGERKFVLITVKNVGDDAVGFDRYQRWID